MAITLNQIAEICGVSRGTVDRALHNKGNVRPAVAERIKAVANEYGYIPNRAGLALSRASHPIRIGVIMFSVQTPFMQIVLDAARREARRLAAFSVEVIFRLSPSLDPVEQVSMIEELSAGRNQDQRADRPTRNTGRYVYHRSAQHPSAVLCWAGKPFFRPYSGRADASGGAGERHGGYDQCALYVSQCVPRTSEGL